MYQSPHQVLFLMKPLTNKFTSIVMDDWNLDEIHTKAWYMLHPIVYDEILSRMIEIWMKDH